MQGKRRNIALILEEIAHQQKYDFKSFSDDWIFLLTDKNGFDCYIWGYKFPNNASSVTIGIDADESFSLSTLSVA